jgi:hypothetical protein
MLQPAHLLSPEEKNRWYEEEKKCRTLPDEMNEEVRWQKEAEYTIHEVGDWIVYRTAWYQADSWNEQHYEDNISFVVVKCSRTFYILTLDAYKKLKA